MGRPNGGQRRRPGVEWRLLGWMLRHPASWIVPALGGAAVAWFGPVPTSATVGALLVAAVSWARAHPASWLRVAAPRVRSLRRRWTVYVGPRWERLCHACDLVRTDRRTGAAVIPRLVRVSSPTPTIDRLTVRLAAGQAVRAWQDGQNELRDTLRADALAITRDRPGVVALTVVRGNPFNEYVPPADIPADPIEVDVHAVELGDTEYGTTWAESLFGQFLLVAGATGSGKGGLIWNPLRALGPLIRAGLLRIWVVDPKGGMETARARGLFHRWADHVTDADDDEFDGDDNEDLAEQGRGESAIRLITEFRDEMKRVQRAEAAAGSRKFTMSTSTPWNVLIVDELAMLTALSGRRATNSLEKLLAEVMTQGRSAGYGLWAFVQEPSKDVVAIRDLFTIRVCLRVNTDTHVDMVLGDGARKRGALADEIPPCESHAGIGYRVDDRTRQPQRVRVGFVTDEDIDELVRTCRPEPELEDGDGGHVIDFPADTPAA